MNRRRDRAARACPAPATSGWAWCRPTSGRARTVRGTVAYGITRRVETCTRGPAPPTVLGPSCVSISGYRRPGGSQAEIGLEVPGLQALLHVAEEAGGVGTVDQTVVVGQEDVHHRPDGDRVVALRVLHHRRSLGDGAGAEDGHVRVRHDRGVEQRTA